MNFIKQLWKKRNNKQPRYASLDYSFYFEQEALNGVRLERRYLGKLGLPGGFVVACDPLLSLHEALPYSRHAPPGQYPVSLLVASSGFRKRNALLKMSFTEQRPQKWELAMLPGKVASAAHADDAYYGFTTEAGFGCLCDAGVQRSLHQHLERFFRDQPEEDVFTSLFSAGFEQNAGLGCNFYLPSLPQMNAMLFHTGYGSGFYPAYWGLAEDGSVCGFVIDFLVL